MFKADANDFRVTLWNMVYDAEDVSREQVREQVGEQVREQVAMILDVLGDKDMSASDLMRALDFFSRSQFYMNYLRPALESGLIEHTIPDKPNSRSQKYRQSV